jgi:hypothetical protein
VTDLAPITPKLANLIRRLSSDQDGEVVATVRALIRTLQGIGADIHYVADRIEHSNNGAFSESDMQQVYDAGIKVGIEREQQRAIYNSPINSTLQMPSARDMALYCYQRIDELKRDWEHEFITNMASWTRVRPLSPKQQAHLEKIYLKLGGRI